MIRLDPELLRTIEGAAMALGLGNIALLIFRNVWNFAFGIAAASLNLGWALYRLTDAAVRRAIAETAC